MTRNECEALLERAGYERYANDTWDYDGVYVLSHGEYERRRIVIRRRRNGNYGIRIEYYFYPNTFDSKRDHYLTGEEEYYLMNGLTAI